MNIHTYTFNFNFINIYNSCVYINIFMRGDTGGSRSDFASLGSRERGCGGLYTA